MSAIWKPCSHYPCVHDIDTVRLQMFCSSGGHWTSLWTNQRPVSRSCDHSGPIRGRHHKPWHPAWWHGERDDTLRWDHMSLRYNTRTFQASIQHTMPYCCPLNVWKITPIMYIFFINYQVKNESWHYQELVMYNSRPVVGWRPLLSVGEWCNGALCVYKTRIHNMDTDKHIH